MDKLSPFELSPQQLSVDNDDVAANPGTVMETKRGGILKKPLAQQDKGLQQ